jgi:hypothetical protein
VDFKKPTTLFGKDLFKGILKEFPLIIFWGFSVKNLELLGEFL